MPASAWKSDLDGNVREAAWHHIWEGGDSVHVTCLAMCVVSACCTIAITGGRGPDVRPPNALCIRRQTCGAPLSLLQSGSPSLLLPTLRAYRVTCVTCVQTGSNTQFPVASGSPRAAPIRSQHRDEPALRPSNPSSEPCPLGALHHFIWPSNSPPNALSPNCMC